MTKHFIKVFSFAMAFCGWGSKTPSSPQTLQLALEESSKSGEMQFVNADSETMSLSQQEGWSPMGERRSSRSGKGSKGHII